MKRHLIGIRVFLAVILFFQAETGHARTVQECQNCTSKSCKGADNKEWCVKNCNVSDIPDCLKISPDIKNEEDAYRYGDIRRLKLLHDIYKEFPLSKYFLDMQAPAEAGREENGILRDEEKQQLKGALKKLAQGCQGILTQLEYSKGRTIPAREQMDKFHQMKELSLALTTDLEEFSQSISIANAQQKNSPSLKPAPAEVMIPQPTRLAIKRAFDGRAGLNLKNCFNMGQALVFKVNQQEGWIDKVITKFNCRECTARNCKKTLESEYNFSLVTKLPNNKKVAPGKIYLEENGGKLAYSVRTPDGQVVRDELDIPVTAELTAKDLETHKSRILTAISGKGHIITPYDNCLKKCPAYRIESCRKAGSKSP